MKAIDNKRTDCHVKTQRVLNANNACSNLLINNTSELHMADISQAKQFKSTREQPHTRQKDTNKSECTRLSELEFHRLNGRSFDDNGMPCPWKFKKVECYFNNYEMSSSSTNEHPSNDALMSTSEKISKQQSSRCLMVRIFIGDSCIERDINTCINMDRAYINNFARRIIVPPFPQKAALQCMSVPCPPKAFLDTLAIMICQYLEMITLSLELRRSTINKMFFCSLESDAQLLFNDINTKGKIEAGLDVCKDELSKFVTTITDSFEGLGQKTLSSSGMQKKSEGTILSSIFQKKAQALHELSTQKATATSETHQSKNQNNNGVDISDEIQVELWQYTFKTTQILLRCEQSLDALTHKVLTESEAMQNFGISLSSIASIMGRGVRKVPKYSSENRNYDNAAVKTSSNIMREKNVRSRRLDNAMVIDAVHAESYVDTDTMLEKALVLSPGKTSLLGLISGIMTQNALMKKREAELVSLKVGWCFEVCKTISEQFSAFVEARHKMLKSAYSASCEVSKMQNSDKVDKLMVLEAHARELAHELQSITTEVLTQMVTADRCIAMCVQSMGMSLIIRGMERNSLEMERWEELLEILRTDIPDIYTKLKE